MRILAVSPRMLTFPVGISYVVSSLKAAGHSVDGMVFDGVRSLEARRPGSYDLVISGGLSLHYKQLLAISETVRRQGGTLVAGGQIITSEPELMSRALQARYSVIGEGEQTMAALAGALDKGEDPRQVEGIGYMEGDRFVLAPPRDAIADLDSLPMPDYEAFGFGEYLDAMKPTLWDMYDVFDHPREYPLITSRSCPFKCTFCYHPAGDKYHQRSLDSVFRELESVVPRYGINLVPISDELFSYSEERVLEFCRRISALRERTGQDIRWSPFMRVGGVKEEMLDAMVASGCYMVCYGLESYNAKVLKSMKKHITPAQIKETIALTKKKPISISATFIFGDREETLETAKETLDYWKDNIDAGIEMDFILALPDSEIYRHAVGKGLITDRLDYIANHLFSRLNLTGMPDGDFYRLRAMVYQYQNKYLAYTIPLRITADSLTVRCPICGATTIFENFAVKHPLGLFYFKRVYCRTCRKRIYAISRASLLARRLTALVTPILGPAIYRWGSRVTSLARRLFSPRR